MRVPKSLRSGGGYGDEAGLRLRPCDNARLWRAVTEGVSCCLPTDPRAISSRTIRVERAFSQIEHFVEAMGATVSASMPGYVPGETIAALVLRAISDSQAHPSGDVVIRPATVTEVDGKLSSQSARLPPAPPQLQTSVSEVIDAKVGVQQEEGFAVRVSRFSSASPVAHLREIVCRLNFQLLQLLRPEYMLICPLALRLSYKREYVQRQVS
jgi:hypothetical protein